MKVTQVTIGIVFLFLSTPSYCDVNLEAEFNGTGTTLEVSILNTYQGEYSGLIITRQSVGLCEDPIIVTSEPIQLPPESILPPPAYAEWVTHSLSFELPHPNVNYKFHAFLVDEGGTQFPAHNVYDHWPPLAPFDYVSNGSAPIMRGTMLALPCGLEGHYQIIIIPCEEGCWGEPEWTVIAACVGQEDILYQNSFLGVVDIIGQPFEPDGMMHDPYSYTISDVVLSPNSECGPVPEEKHTFGGFKALYRSPGDF